MAKLVVVLIAVAVMGVSSTAMARGGGGGGGGKGGSGVSHFHGRFDNHFLRNHFLRNQAVLGGWGWDWGWGYGDNGYGNTTVVAFPQATPQAANVTGSIATGPCHWNADTFNVPSAAGGTRPVQVYVAAECRAAPSVKRNDAGAELVATISRSGNVASEPAAPVAPNLIDAPQPRRSGPHRLDSVGSHSY